MIRPIVCPDMAPLFAPTGPVARLLGGRYRLRAGQVQMAELVAGALREPKHVVVEAGTGIGKSFAYLVPVIWAGAQAVVSTSNKALMAQLWHKDLPALQKIAPRPFTAALLKGRSNYLCAKRLVEFRATRRLPGLAPDAERVEQGLATTPTGDCEEMRLPLSLAQQLTVDHRACDGGKCPHFGECFYERAKEAAQEADVVVTNHALLCYSLLQGENSALPVRPVLIADEAHELEGYAINALTQALEYETLATVINHPLTADAADPAIRQQAMEFNHAFFEAIEQQRPKRTSTAWALHDEIQEGLGLWNALEQIRSKLMTHRVGQDEQGALETLQCFTGETQVTVHALAHPEPPSYIRVCTLDDADGGKGYAGLRPQYRPLEVAEMLRLLLFDAWPRVICTSATLSVDNDLGWFGRRVGAPLDGPATAVSIPSPFDYQRQVLIYTPNGLIPAYEGEGEAQYLEKLTAEVERLIHASRGRAFVLCTSRKRMNQLYEQLSLTLPYPCLCQGQGLSRRELIEEFEDAGDAVLFATRSFWEGVDIPGEALSLVILDKLPFLPVDDPVLQRREELVKAAGGDPFAELQLGHAILTLRQGAGRLVRSETDRGVIAVLDSRINTKAYGRKIVRSLPNGRQVMRCEDVERFFVQQPI
jgi:Rad3-related DNA helicase